MIYKVIIEKVVFVEADSVEEAEDSCFNNITAFEEERIESVTKSSRAEIDKLILHAIAEAEEGETE